jgi:hypothetical protein
MAGRPGSLQTQTLLVRSLRTSGKCQNLQAHAQPVCPWARVAAVPAINCFSQDTTACLLAGGRLVAFAKEVRSRPRAAPKAFPASAIAFCWQPASCRPRSATPARTCPTAASVRCCATPGVRLNLDLLSQVERLGRLAPAARSACGSTRGREHSRNAPGAPPGTRDQTGRRSPASTPSRAARPCPAAAPAALGYGQIDPRGAELLFQIITKRDTPRFHSESNCCGAKYPGSQPISRALASASLT